MGTTVELDTSKYKVDEATADQFANISNFAKTMTIKDSKYFEEAETELSKRFASLMVKYFDQGLSNSENSNEFGEIIRFIKTYNDSINDKFSGANLKPDLSEEEKLQLILKEYIKTYGLLKDQNYNNSIINMIMSALYEKSEKEVFNNYNDIVAYIIYKYFRDDIDIYNFTGSLNIQFKKLFTDAAAEGITSGNYKNVKELDWIINYGNFAEGELKDIVYKNICLNYETNAFQLRPQYYSDLTDEEKKNLTDEEKHLLNSTEIDRENFNNEKKAALETIIQEIIETRKNTYLTENEISNLEDEDNSLELMEELINKKIDINSALSKIIHNFYLFPLDPKDSIINVNSITYYEDTFHISDGDLTHEFKSSGTDYELYENKEKTNKKYSLKYKFNDTYWDVNWNDGSSNFKFPKVSIDYKETTIGRIREYSNEIENLKETFKRRNLILIEEVTGSNTKKLVATEEEKQLLRDSNIVFMDINGDPNGGTNPENFVHYLIIYRDFNPRYRNLFDSSFLDLVLNHKEKNGQFVYSTIFKMFSNGINVKMTRYIRNIASSDILIRDFEKQKKTSQQFKYIYGNLYFARKANESDIIKYFIGDKYQNGVKTFSANNSSFTHGYGLYDYEKEEIYSFLDIYSQVRNYFYRVLLNESFINEKEYKLFEKTFLIFWSIERFISSKIDNLKDINLMDMNDSQNFLTSYGLGHLAEIIENNDFYNSEAYVKNILKSFISLVQNKGTHIIIEILQNIFSENDSELTVFNSYLFYDDNTTDEDTTTPTSGYYFMDVNYDEENVLAVIAKDRNKKVEMSDYVADDFYWDVENTSNSLIKALGVNTVSTKYLTPQLSEEISSSFFFSRYIMSIIDFIFDSIDPDVAKDLSVSSKTFNSNLNLKDFIGKLRELIASYLDIKNRRMYNAKFNETETGDIVENNTIDNINDNFINNYYSFKINITDGEEYTDFVNDNLLKYYIITENSISLNTDAIMADFHKETNLSSISNTSSYKFFKDIFTNLMPIIGLKEFGDKLINCAPDLFSNAIINIDFSFVSMCIDKIMAFCQLIYNGQSGTPISNLPWMTSDMLEYIYRLHDNIFMKDKIHNSLYPSKITQLADLSELNYVQSIIDACKELSEVLDIVFQIRVGGTEESTLKFLKEVIDYFVAYSTLVYKTIYKREYNRSTEFFAVTDKIMFMKSFIDMDSFYYDEELSINLSDKEVIT